MTVKKLGVLRSTGKMGKYQNISKLFVLTDTDKNKKLGALRSIEIMAKITMYMPNHD